MTITLKPETARAIEAAARQRGITVDELIDERLATPAAPDEDAEQAALRARIRAVQAQFAHVPGSTEDFMARKAEEKALEERRWHAHPDGGSTP